LWADSIVEIAEAQEKDYRRQTQHTRQQDIQKDIQQDIQHSVSLQCFCMTVCSRENTHMW